MEIIDLSAILITLAALFSFVNYRYIKLPPVIGVMILGMVFSLMLLLLQIPFPHAGETVKQAILEIDFNKTLMHGMLSFLLFAGALHVNLNDLVEQKWVVGILATIGVASSTLIVGTLSWLLLYCLDINLSFIYCLLFGALISPTDPIAVLGILKKAKVPKSLEVKISGESLFNDGVGVVIFIVISGIAAGSSHVDGGSIFLLFIEEAVGGLLLGLVLGFSAHKLLSLVDDYKVEVLLSLAIVIGGDSLARAIHTSGPIAIVVAGLFIGNKGRLFAMSDNTRMRLDNFWELLDEILNALLFVLIGLELSVLPFNKGIIFAGALMIPVVLFSRFTAVGLPVNLLKLKHEFSPNIVKIMTWGGLRGGISVALALSIPNGEARAIILPITYIIVVFSIIFQGLTIGPLVKKLCR